MIECPKMVMVPLMITVMEKVNSVRGKQGDQCSLLKTKHKFRCHIPLKSVCRKGISEPQKKTQAISHVILFEKTSVLKLYI
jgi:hypothetical protein